MTAATDSHASSQEMLAQAGAAIDRKDPKQAAELAVQVLEREPNHPGAHYLAGLACLDLGQLGRGLEHLQRAASISPKTAEYAVHFARALARAHRNSEAIQVANIAACLPPASPLTLDTLGTVYMQCHAYERANATFRRAAALLPGNAICRFNLGITLTFTGDTDAAEKEFEACLAIQPDYWRCYGVRSRLRRQTSQRNHLDQLLQLVDRHPDTIDAQMHLHSALGKEYEDLGELDKAFHHYSLAKSAPQVRRNYKSADDEALVDALIRAFPAPGPQAGGYACDEPIFVVGMPRSGTTLVERIISSHPEVHAGGELQNFGVQAQFLAGAQSPAMLDLKTIESAKHIDWERLGLRYVASTRPQTTNKPRFTDKLPHNFMYIGFIANALPKAKIICLRRNAMDTCLSNFRELFMEASPYHGYSFDLLDIGRFYIQFDRLMAHWKKIFPGRILEIDYEEMVATQEATSRKLLDYCDLPWNDACLRFESNPAAVATASTAQVRQSMHGSSIDRWKDYGAMLAPLEELLNSAGIATRE